MSGHLALEVDVAELEADLASGTLFEAGAAGLEERPASAPGRSTFLVYFPARDGLRVEVAALLPGAQVRDVDVPQVDWVARFRETFRGFDVGSFRIAPPWDLPTGPGDRLIVMDPGRAFGTGTHETTRLCVRALESLAARRPLGRLLDLGTGTGLLAIVGLRLGASLALGTDNDPDATASAVEHARLNQAPLRVVLGDLARPLRPYTFDVVVANLMAPLLLARRAEIAALLRPGATLLLSGLLRSDVDEVGAAYAPLGPAQLQTDGEWACLAFGC